MIPYGSAPAPSLPGTAAYSIPATGAPEYTYQVATLADATPAALAHTGYFVRAWTGPSTYYDSGLEYGMSIDDLAPPAPTILAAAYEAGATHLHWDVSAAPDFAAFRLYRGTDASFDPGPANLLVTTPDTGYVDVGPAGRWYKLAAVDESGNEGVFSSLGPEQTVDVGNGPALAFDLAPMRPNPSSARVSRALVVRFTLPREAPATLELIDVAGRRVAFLPVGALGVGAHAVDLAADSPRLRSGVYCVRLVQGRSERSRRVVLLD